MALEPVNPSQPPQFLTVMKAASSLNTYDDPQTIADSDAADALNVVFDRGLTAPRKGSVLAWSLPTGETNTLLNLINAVTSDRHEYVIAVYAPNIYVLDETNGWWIPINGSYTPSQTYKALPYGYNIWNAGVGSDALYMGNGREDTIKWSIALDYVAISAPASAGTLTLTNAAQFPANGTVSIKTLTTQFTVTYGSKTGNVLNLSTPLSAAVPNGSPVAPAIQDMSSMPKGKIFAKFQGRQFIANSYQSETTMFYSNVGTPENFTVAGTPSGGGFYGFVQGTGEVTGLMDLGQYLGVLKEDSLHKFEFSIDATQTTKLDQVNPLLSDRSMGCPYFKQWIKKNGTLYYPSETAGVMSIAPVVTGNQTSIQLQLLDSKIHNLYQSLQFTNGRAAEYDTKIFFSCATNTAIDTILVYDVLRQYWTRFNNWAVADWLSHKGSFYFGSYQDGNVYKCFDNSYTDNNNSYTVSNTTKRFDFGSFAMPKTESRLFVQGYINTSTTIYCDVMFNEKGQQQVLTYKIIGAQPYAVQPITPAMAQAMMGAPIFGASTIDSLDNMALFKCYLALPIRYGFFNIQFKFYSVDAGSNWSITGIAMNPRTEMKSPENITINVDGLVPIPTPTVSAQS